MKKLREFWLNANNWHSIDDKPFNCDDIIHLREVDPKSHAGVEAYIARVFPCRKNEVPPEACDSYGVCDNCCDATLIRVGAEIQLREADKLEKALIHIQERLPDYPQEFVELYDVATDALAQYSKSKK
jgi:hypothetical protein